MRKITRLVPVFGLCLLLSGCPRPVRAPEPAPSEPAATAVDMRGAAVYEVRPQQSEVNIYVYRGGTLSRLGHNHVVTSRSLSGRVGLREPFTASSFELSFPVRELIVDDPQDRRAAGSDFPPEIPQADKDGTRKNMLRAEVLDADRYPTIRLVSAQVDGTPEAPRITAQITIKDVSHNVDVPMKLVVDGGQLTASGELEVLQTQFGIKPFSIALGALQVQDRLGIRFKIVAMQK